jgi:undecaprenyl-diphosphatase
MEDHSFSQKYYTMLIDWIMSIPLWIDLLLLVVIAMILYLAIHMILPALQNTFLPLVRSIWGSLKEAFGKNHDLISLKNKYPRIFSFIHARLDTSHFCGLSMTLFSLLVLYIIALFGGLVEDLITHDSIVEVDHLIAVWSTTIRTDLFNEFFWAITQLGRIWVIGFLVAFFSLFLWFSHRRYYLLGLYVSIIGSEILTITGKYAFARERPSAALYHEALYSFPSGHATLAVAFFGFVLYTFFQETPDFRSKLNLFFIALILIFLIGMSRIYLGVHYMSDIWAGYLVGAIWMVIGMALSEYQRSNVYSKKLDLEHSNRLAWAIGIVAFVCYLLFLYWHPLSDKF